MRLTRVHVGGPLRPSQRYVIGGGAAGHLVRVLRLRAGDPLTLFDGAGGEYPAEVVTVGRDDVAVSVGEHDPVERESPLRLTLLQGISRGERMDWVVQKATELGVSVIVPLLTVRSMVSLNGDSQVQKKLHHWSAIAIGACEQSGRNLIPQIAAPCTLQQYLARTAAADAESRLLLSPTASHTLADLQMSDAAATLLIGPEGGLSAEEQDVAQLRGFQGVRMGPRVLRTETAAVTALTVLQHRFGDL
jgi:16S rRNA (uracil1498-N3)-methyltransferase